MHAHDNDNDNLKLTNRTGWRLNCSWRNVASVVRMANSQEGKKEIYVPTYFCFLFFRKVQKYYLLFTISILMRL
jgi:hypothetical protein